MTAEARRQARAALIVVAAGNFLVQLAMMPVSAMLPTVAQVFGVEVTAAAWVMNAYLLTLTGLVLTTGRLGDLYGHRRVYGAGIVVFTISALLAGLAPTLPVMVVARAGQGIGGALMLGNALAILVALVPAGERGRAIGLTTIAASLGSLLGVVMASFLTAYISWRWVFLIVAPAGLYALWQARQLPAGAARPAGAPRPDLLGAVLLFLLLTTLSLSFSHLHDGTASFQAGWAYHTGMQVLTAALVAAFIVVETRVKMPMMPLRLFRHRRFTMAILANLTLHMTMMGSMFLVPFLVEQGMGLPPSATGRILIPMQLASIAASYGGGWLYDRTRSRLITPLSLLAIGLGMGLLGLAGAQMGELGLLLLLVGVGVATNVFQTANNTAAMSALPASLGGFASGTLETSRQLGHTVAVALAAGVLGLVAEQALTGTAAQAEATHGLSLAILSFSVVAFGGVIFAIFGGEASRAPTTSPVAVTAPYGADD